MTDRPQAADPRRVVPDWPAPARVRAFVTTRDGGTSVGPWRGAHGGGMNLGLGSGDDRDAVRANRAVLERHLPSPPAWLKQVHGTRVVDAATVGHREVEADAAFTSVTEQVCVVLVADCMPVFFCEDSGTRVAVAHAGWRGLAAGVLEATLDAGGFAPARTLAWLGPAIGPRRFEVGDEVRDAFVGGARAADLATTSAAFVPHAPGKWLADLAALATTRLAARGVRSIHRSGLCTASSPERFYSYRRDGVTGRMAAVIWLAGAGP